MKILILLLLSTVSHAEYIFVPIMKINDKRIYVSEIYKEIDRKVFEILDTLQFPQNKNMYFRKKWNLSEFDFRQLISSEYHTLKRLIREKTSFKEDFELIYIPNLLFEAIMTHFHLKNLKLELKSSAYGLEPFHNNYRNNRMRLSLDHFLYSMIKKDNNASEDFIKLPPHILNRIKSEKSYDSLFYETYEATINYSTSIRRLTNNFFGIYINSEVNNSKSSQPVSIMNIYPNLLEKVYNKMEDNKNHFRAGFLSRTSPDAKTINLLNILIKKESLIYYSNQFPLYRGSTRIDRTDLFEKTETLEKFSEEDIEEGPFDFYSMSFANSVFAGIINDNSIAKGACFWVYATEPETKFSYILSLNKYQLLRKDQDKLN